MAIHITQPGSKPHPQGALMAQTQKSVKRRASGQRDESAPCRELFEKQFRKPLTVPADIAGDDQTPCQRRIFRKWLANQRRSFTQ